MGLRSWLTKVDEVSEYVSLCSQIRHNPIANGVVYVIHITADCPAERGVWVAWSGDGRSSLCEFMSPYFAGRTLILDNLLDECPGYNDDPSQYGHFLASEADVISVLIQQEGSGDEDICSKMKEEMSFSGECHAELSKHERFREYEKRQDELLHWLAEEMARFEEADSPGEAEVATGVVVQHDGACLEAGSVLKDA